MPTCALCGSELTAATDSREHLIPNAIGGRKKVRGFICSTCNNGTGESWDSELAKNLNGLSVLFNVKRERGEVPDEEVATTSGEMLTYPADGPMVPRNPKFESTPTNAGVEINIAARSVREARQMMKGVKKKYPQINLEDLLSKSEVVSRYPNEYVHFSLCFGGPLAGRAVVKMALCLAVSNGIAPEKSAIARRYLLDEEADACFGYFYARDLVRARPDGVPIHCVAIRGCPKSGLLLGYVELFGVQRSVVCLNDRYDGAEIDASYTLDPRSGQEISLPVDLDLTLEEVRASYDYKMIPEGSVEAALEAVLPSALKNADDRERSRVASRAVENAFKASGCGEGERLTEEHISRISSELTVQLEPYILHLIGRKK
ncbi:MAG: HNH endonuclease [Chromatiaceae bacterium]|nr:HNH endonuclease [Chromatiaceae bacterium]MCF8017685.1 HNH endonuclease [Chromatiaceae bacterium]